MTMALVSGGLQVAGGILGNKENTANAKAEYYSNKAFIERNYDVTQNSYEYAGEELNNQIGAALSDAVYSTLKAKGSLGASTAETGAFGNTAARKQAVLALRAEMQKDRIIQQGESQMVDLQNKMAELKYATEDQHHQNKQAFNNRMSQNKSTFDIIAGGVSAGISGYSSGLSMQSAELANKSAQNIVDLQEEQLAGLMPKPN